MTTSSDTIGDLLDRARTVAVVGLSPDPAKDSHQIARYLQQAGYEILPVNPGAKTILGRTSYPNLNALPGSPDIVQILMALLT